MSLFSKGVNTFKELRSLKLSRVSLSCFMKFSTSSFRSKEKLDRDKENINIVTIGSEQHGKTWLASQLTLALSQQNDGVVHKTVDMIDHSASEKENKRSEHASHMELWRKGSKYRFTLADLPGSTTYIKNNLNHLAHADVGILVVSPDLGVDKNTRLFYHLADHFGVKLIVPAITLRPDTDEETLDLIMMELSELENIIDPVVIGDKDQMKFLENIEHQVDNMSITSLRHSEKPFFMALEQVGNIPSRGMFCAGRVLQGTMTASSGSSLEAFYHGKSSKINSVREMEVFRKVTDSLTAGDRGGAFIKLKQDIELKRGAVIYDPKTKIVPSEEFEVSLKSVSGQKTIKGDCVFYHSTNTDGKASIVGNTADVGDEKETLVKVKLSQKILTRGCEPFVLRNNQHYFKGVIVK